MSQPIIKALAHVARDQDGLFIEVNDSSELHADGLLPEGTELCRLEDAKALDLKLAQSDYAYDSSMESIRRLVRELDVLLNGEDGAAKQASLCDIVGQVASVVRERGAPLLSPAQIEDGEEVDFAQVVTEKIRDAYYERESITEVAAAIVAQHERIVAGLKTELHDETESCDQWRQLALQFDRHRMTALAHLRAVVSGKAADIAACQRFLAQPPVPAHEITAELDVLREYRNACIGFNNSFGAETETLEEAVQLERQAEARLEAAEKACHDFYAGRLNPHLAKREEALRATTDEEPVIEATKGPSREELLQMRADADRSAYFESKFGQASGDAGEERDA